MTNPNIEPVPAVVAIVTMVLSPSLAEIVGPYLVIILGAVTGTYFRISQRGPMGRMEALGFFVITAGVAMLLTVPLCEIVQRYIPARIEAEWLFGPMAFSIGLVGERWPLIGQWAGRKLSKLVDALIRSRAGGNGESDGNNDAR